MDILVGAYELHVSNLVCVMALMVVGLIIAAVVHVQTEWRA